MRAARGVVILTILFSFVFVPVALLVSKETHIVRRKRITSGGRSNVLMNNSIREHREREYQLENSLEDEAPFKYTASLRHPRYWS